VQQLEGLQRAHLLSDVIGIFFGIVVVRQKRTARKSIKRARALHAGLDITEARTLAHFRYGHINAVADSEGCLHLAATKRP
jgi:hypothetical protein